MGDEVLGRLFLTLNLPASPVFVFDSSPLPETAKKQGRMKNLKYVKLKNEANILWLIILRNKEEEKEGKNNVGGKL